MLRLIILFVCLVGAQMAAAEPVRLTGDAIKQTVAGSTLEIDTPLGTTVPIRFTDDGLMSGEAKDLAPMLGSATDRGRWWIADNQLCHKWFRWFEAEVHCLVIRQDGTRFFWQRDDGESGTATLVEQGKGVTEPRLPVSAVAATVEQRTKEPVRASTPPPSGPTFVTASADPASASPPQRPAQAAVQPSTPPAREQLLPTRRSVLPRQPINRPAQQLSAQAETPTRPAVERKFAQAAAVAARPQVQPASPRSEEPTVSFRVSGVDTYDVLYIRSGPSQDHTSVGMIPPTGRGIVITGRCRDDWCPVRHRNIAGWVNRYYLAQDAAR